MPHRVILRVDREGQRNCKRLMNLIIPIWHLLDRRLKKIEEDYDLAPK
jgi:hypothetical protein